MSLLLPVLAVTPVAHTLGSTVTTFPLGDPKLATSDPSNTTGLVMVILVNLVILVGGVLLYLHHRRPRTERDADASSVAPSATGEAGPPAASAG